MRRVPLLIGIGLALVLFSGFGLVAGRVVTGSDIVAFDAAVGTAVRSWRAPWLTPVMAGITAAGSTPAVTICAVALAVALGRRRRWLDAAFTSLLVAGTGALSSLTKLSFARARPPIDSALIALPGSFSFPSGHTMGSIALACVVSYVALRAHWSRRDRTAVILAAIFYTAAVGASRVYLGVHWPSDVVAGWLLGGALASVSLGVYEAFRDLQR